MKEIIKERLVLYLAENHPDLMSPSEAAANMEGYLDHKIALLQPEIVQWEEQNHQQELLYRLADHAFSQILPRSKYNFIKDILKEDFPLEYADFESKGILKLALLNLLKLTDDLFTNYDFQEKEENDRFLSFALIAAIHDFLT